MNVIDHAFNTGMLINDFIRYDEFIDALKLGKAYALNRIRGKIQRVSTNNVHSYMSWWGGFSEQPPSLSPISFATLAAGLAQLEKREASLRTSPSKKAMRAKSSKKSKKKKKGKRGGGSSKKKRR